MDKKIILHIIDSMWLWWAQTVVKWIFEKQQDNNSIFLYVLRKREINIEVNHSNVYKYNSRSLYSFFPILELKNLIKENNIQILHCHLFRSQVFWWILKKLFFPNIKLIFHEHWEIFENGFKYTFLMNKFQNILDCYIAVSEATKQKLIENAKIKENKIKVLYNFVDIDKFKKLDNFDKKTEREKYWLKENDFIIGFAWRFVERKWWREFINSAKYLIDLWYNFKFIIAWNWEDKKKLLQQIEKYENNIKFIWYIENMVNFYNQINIFVIPSYWEWLPMTQLEAVASWVLVVSSDWPWLNEVIINQLSWVYFINKNIIDLSNKIIDLSNDIDLRDNLINNWKEEVKKYSLDNYLLNLNSIYFI